MSVINALVGAASLFLGRQLFWLFVAAAGFVLGFNAGTEFLGEQAAWLVLAIALVAGILGALLALFLQRVAIAVAGFIAGGYLLLNLSDLLGFTGGGDGLSLLALILFVVGGVLGAVLVNVLFDVALIVLSSALGAMLLSQAADAWFTLDQTISAIIFILLLLLGIGAQWATWQRMEGREAA
jgi:hypothetical protein